MLFVFLQSQFTETACDAVTLAYIKLNDRRALIYAIYTDGIFLFLCKIKKQIFIGNSLEILNLTHMIWHVLTKTYT